MNKLFSYAILLVFLSSTNLLVNAQSDSEINSNYISKGFFNNTDIGLLLGSSQNTQKSPLSFLSVTGYHFNPKLAVGLGVGLDLLNESYIPLVADIRYYFRNTNFSPFIFFQGGYHIPVEDRVSYQTYDRFNGLWIIPDFSIEKINSKGGLIINPGFGLRKMFGSNFGLTFAVSYRYHRLKYEATEDNKLEIEYNRLNLRVGIIFK